MSRALDHGRKTAPPPEALLPFADESAVRRIHGEGILILGGGRALLMQIAHPAIARGVAAHSSYRGDRFGRLLRTLRPMLAIAFGSREQALAAAASVNRAHEPVRGPGYDARDPGLLLWVLATLIDTTLVMHGRFVRPLTGDEAAAYYEDMAVVGGLLGLPREQMPPDVGALARYVERMVESLEVTSEARSIAADLFRSSPLTWPLLEPTRQLTAGLLPPRLRREFGLGWGPARETALEALSRASRAALPRLPRRLRRPPWFLMPPRDPKARTA